MSFSHISIFKNKDGRFMDQAQSDVIKMREMRGEMGKKTPKKEMDNPSFYEVT